MYGFRGGKLFSHFHLSKRIVELLFGICFFYGVYYCVVWIGSWDVELCGLHLKL